MLTCCIGMIEWHLSVIFQVALGTHACIENVAMSTKVCSGKFIGIIFQLSDKCIWRNLKAVFLVIDYNTL